MSTEDEYELNFMKIDSNNNVNLIGVNDFETELIYLMEIMASFEGESIDGILLKYFNKFIPSTQDLLKTNIELSKQTIKNIHSDKKTSSLSDSVNRILSIDYKGKFIFNKKNIQDVSNILSNSFNDLKKYKITSFTEFQQIVKKIDFKKYKINQLYLNNEYIKNKKNNLNHLSFSRTKTGGFSTNSSFKELYEESEYDDNPKFVNRYNNKEIGITYIDNKNIICSSYLTDDYNYDEENVAKKLLTKECFLFQKNNKDDSELPIELIILLYKLKDVKTLIFQINNVDEQFFKNAIFIFINIKWLFMNDIEEINFDLGNEELQKGIIEIYNDRVDELYNNFEKVKNTLYYNGSYKARTFNLWVPEGDIFFEKINYNQDNKNEYIYSEQPNIEECTFDNHLCNIYNEFGKLANLKYIRPIIYTMNNNENKNDKNFDVFIDEDNNLPFDQRSDRESTSLSSSNTMNLKNTSLNLNQNNNNRIDKTTPGQLKEYVKKHIYSFQMISIYSYFLKDFKKLKKLNLYFHMSYSFEIQLMMNMFNIVYDRFHFLVFTKNIDTLTEANFSFNSLDSKSFENILAIINKNSNLTSLKLSFFTTDINYFDNSLFNLWSPKLLNIKKLFIGQKKLLMSGNGGKERDMNYYILHQFLDSFEKNLKNFFNLLKVKALNNLEELILRFDIPLSILNSEKYNILLVKFIINLLIMLTFLDNRIHTLKLLAPDLSFNSFKMPYIRQFFNEIMLEREQIDVKLEEKIKTEKKRKEKIRIIQKQRQKKEKEIEIRQKNIRKDLLQYISSNFSPQDDLKKNEKKEIEKKLNIDIDNNSEHFNTKKRFRSVLKKTKTTYLSNEVRPKETINSDTILDQQRRHLNKNITLENLTIQFKIYNLPEIFNICLMNNLKGLKYINLGYLDDITFIAFVNDFKANSDKLVNLTSLKISLGISIVSYVNLEKYIIEYININSPILEEKFLFSNLKLVNEEKMDELIELVYFKAITPKLVIQLGNDNDTIHLLSKDIGKYIKKRKIEMNYLLMLMDLPKYNKLYNWDIIKCIASFYLRKGNRAIICKENPYN